MEVAATIGLPRSALVRHVILPSALPNFLTGLRYAIGIAWLSLVVRALERTALAWPAGREARAVSAADGATQVRGLVRRFGPTAVLDGPNLDVPAGRFVALLGRSGSGKTTLLRTLAGLDTAEQGSVTLPARRAVVFQEPRPMPWKGVCGKTLCWACRSMMRATVPSRRCGKWNCRTARPPGR